MSNSFFSFRIHFYYCVVLTKVPILHRAVLGQAYRGLTSGVLLLRIYGVAIFVSPHVYFILDLILISVS